MLARGPYGDFDILAEGGQKIHQTLDGKDSGLAAHQAGDVRLRDAEQYSRLGLGEIAFFDETVDLQSQARLELLALGVGEAEIGETLPFPSLTGILASFFCMSVLPLPVILFGDRQPLANQVHLFPGRRDALRRFLLERVQNINRVPKPHRIDGAIGASRAGGHDLQDGTAGETFQRLYGRILLTALRGIESLADIAPHRWRKRPHILAGRSHPPDRFGFLIHLYKYMCLCMFVNPGCPTAYPAGP